VPGRSRTGTSESRSLVQQSDYGEVRDTGHDQQQVRDEESSHAQASSWQS
jgi:hypothetical protein